jgi:hypothetical protein
MLDLPGAPVLDKAALIGGCLRLPLAVDSARLRAEVEALTAAVWGTAGGRVGVHSKAEAAFLRGYAPAEGDKPIVDRELLDSLPYARVIIEQLIPAQPLRCLLARLPPGVSIAPHIDRAPYFSKSIRIHVPVVTHELAWMMAGSQCYLMRPGEVWALNNSGPHAVWNAHEQLPRTHLICDFLPSEPLLALMARGERAAGMTVAAVNEHFAVPGRRAATAANDRY